MAEQEEDTRPESARIAEALMANRPDRPPEALVPVVKDGTALADLAAAGEIGTVPPPKRRRRTKAQIEADKIAEVKAARAEAAAGQSIPPAPTGAYGRQSITLHADTGAVTVEPEVPLTVHQAILAVMRDVQSVGKSETNDDDGFAFRGVDAMVNAVGPSMRTHGLLMLPVGAKIAYRDVPGTNLREAIGNVKYKLIGPDGSSQTVKVPGESLDSSDKGAAKLMSVAWRIALIQTFVVPTGDRDPDKDSHKRGTPSARRASGGQAMAGEENQAADGRQAAAGEESQVKTGLRGRSDAERLMEAKVMAYGWEALKLAPKDLAELYGKTYDKYIQQATEAELKGFLADLEVMKTRVAESPEEAEARELAEVARLNEDAERKARDEELAAEAAERAHEKIRKANGASMGEASGDE